MSSPTLAYRMKTTAGLIYLYCVTSSVPKLKEAGQLAGALSFIYHQGIYAVVAEVNSDEFSEEGLKRNFADLGWVKRNATAHEKVIEGIMGHTAVIPFKFGTLFKNEESLNSMLEKHLKGFKITLNELKGKEEWGLKAYCDIERLRAYLIREDEGLIEIEKEAASSPSGKAYLLKKKKEDLLNVAVNKKLNEYAQECFETLKRKSLKAAINKLLPKEVTEKEEEMILNAAFLVDKKMVSGFADAVKGVKLIYAEEGLFFDLTGPWPPYNFCEATT